MDKSNRPIVVYSSKIANEIEIGFRGLILKNQDLKDYILILDVLRRAQNLKKIFHFQFDVT